MRNACKNFVGKQAKNHLEKSDWGTLVPRIKVENSIKLGFLLE
jgi:hypothetical protein